MEALNRRELLTLAAVPAFSASSCTTPQTPALSGLFTCMHQSSSANFDFRTAMEGYARAGIRAVEIILSDNEVLTTIRDFAKQESLGAARRLLGDLGLQVVSTSGQGGLDESGEARVKNLEDLKWKCELAQAIGCDRMVAYSEARQPSDATEWWRHQTARKSYTTDNIKITADNLYQAGEIARPYNITLMVEFTRHSMLISTLRTALKVVREAAHPNVRVMIDTFHFWSSRSKLEDLDLLRDGELHHLHFEDTPAYPPIETLEQRHRVYPGEGIAPLRRIIEVLKQKRYSGPASLELFDSTVVATDPYEVARKARATIEPLIA